MKQFLLLHIGAMLSLLLMFVHIQVGLFISLCFNCVSIATLCEILSQSINTKKQNKINFDCLSINFHVFGGFPVVLFPFYICSFSFASIIELIYSVTLLATMLTTTLWSIPQFKKLGLSRIWSLFIYIPIIRLWVLHITIKALNEKIKEAQLN